MDVWIWLVSCMMLIIGLIGSVLLVTTIKGKNVGNQAEVSTSLILLVFVFLIGLLNIGMRIFGPYAHEHDLSHNAKFPLACLLICAVGLFSSLLVDSCLRIKRLINDSASTRTVISEVYHRVEHTAVLLVLGSWAWLTLYPWNRYDGLIHNWFFYSLFGLCALMSLWDLIKHGLSFRK